jgi:hypothetical protein
MFIVHRIKPLLIRVAAQSFSSIRDVNQSDDADV